MTDDLDVGRIRLLVADLVPALGTVVRLRPLTGGLLNWVWRAEGTASTAIVKLAPPYVATSPELALSPERIHFEARALELFTSSGALASLARGRVRVPTPLAFLPDENLLVEEDFGVGPDLAGLPVDVKSGEPEDARALGLFIRRLHDETAAEFADAGAFDNRSVQETRKLVQYDAVRGALDAANIPGADEAEAIAERLGEELLERGRCLVMGDLWPRSILPRDGFVGLIDWEFVHWGIPAQDIGHLGAHLWMLATKTGEPSYTKAWRAFSSAWEEHDETTRVHFGCEIIARTVGAFADTYLFADDPAAARGAATIAADLIRGMRTLETIWSE